MSITHSTFNADSAPNNAPFGVPFPPDYTVFGGSVKAAANVSGAGLSAVLLNRGSRIPRRHVFASLSAAGYDSIVSVETGGGHYELEALSDSFPQVRFVLLEGRHTIGEQINIAANEVRSPLFFVLWNDLRLLYGLSAAKITERLMLPLDDAVAGKSRVNWFRRLCTVPIFQNAQFEQLPTVIAPVFLPQNSRGRFETTAYSAAKENAPSVFPFQGVGIYDRARFFAIDGFDTAIKNPHWQLADFGLRAWLRGEEIRCTHHIHLRYGAEFFDDADYPPLSAEAGDADFWLFYAKNLLPVLRRSGIASDETYSAYLPLKKLPVFLIKSGGRIGERANIFFSTRAWLREKGHGLTRSARALFANWPV